MPADSHPTNAFPRLRWAALLWLAVFLPSYAHQYGVANLLFLCDLAAILACIGLWRGSALLLSSQAVSSLVVDLLWNLDVLWRLLLGRHLLGGTAYMWDARLPPFIRLLSSFHIVLPFLLLWALRRVGYDRRGLLLQSAIATMAVVAARFAGPAANINYAHIDPIFKRSFGPAPIHLAVTVGGLVALAYVPTHLILARLYRPPAS